MAGAHAQTGLTIRAANSVNSQVLKVQFSPPATQVLNTDGPLLGKLDALVLVTNPINFGIDLYAADNINHHILLYAGDFCPAAPLASPPAPACPTTGSVLTQANTIIYPNGLSADTAGNLFAVDTAPGSSPLPQVWVVPFNSQTGVYGNAVPIDTTSPGGTLGKKQPVVESMIVGAPLGVPNCLPAPQVPTCLANVGDLLVVSNTPDEILRYAGNSATGTGPLTARSPTTLIRQCANTKDTNCIPVGSLPQGIAVWPADNTVLITVSGGRVLRFDLSTGAVKTTTTLAGLPSSLVKIKTANTKAGPLGFVLMNGMGNHGSILELGSCANNPGIPACIGKPATNIAVLASVSAGVAAPLGLAVTSAVSDSAIKCQQGNGCNLLGNAQNNVLTHKVGGVIPGGSLQGNITEDVCVVADTRADGHGHCGNQTVTVNQVCPGFDNTNSLVIPGYLCGASGGGTNFALVRTLTTHAQNNVDAQGHAESEFNGTYIESSADSVALLPGPSLTCGAGGTATLVWAPLAGEGTIVEGPYLADITSGCGTGHGGSGYASLWAIGLGLDTTALGGLPYPTQPLWNFANTKYGNLKTTIANLTPANIAANLSTQFVVPTYGTSTAIPGCVDESFSNFVAATTNDPNQTAEFQNAANLLTGADTVNSTSCDYVIENVVNNNLPGFTETSSPLVLNPSGQLRSRLANLYFTINSEILGNPAGMTWPPAVSPTINVSPALVMNTGSTNIAYGLNGNVSGCTVTSDDPTFSTLQPQGSGSTPGGAGSPGGAWPASAVTQTYTYTLMCNVPLGTVANNGTTMSVVTHLTVWPTVTVTPASSSVVAGTSVEIDWTPPGGALNCVLTDNGSGVLTPISTYKASYQTTPADEDTGVTFTVNCSFGASPGSSSITVTPPPVAVVVNPTNVIGGQPTQVTWTPPALATVCMLTTDGLGSFATMGQGATSDAGPADGMTADVVTYNSALGDNAVVNFMASCATHATPGQANPPLTVTPPP
jgi:hypothetical protein